MGPRLAAAREKGGAQGAPPNVRSGMPAAASPGDLYRALREGRFEAALAALQGDPQRLPVSRLAPLVARLQHLCRDLRADGEIGAWRRTQRHIFALRALMAHGPQPRRLIRDVELALDYDGKILLMKLAGGLPDGKLCLRGGDEWHREILRNTAAEMRDLGFAGVAVLPLGGGSLRMTNRRCLRLWGTSDEFGRCDMTLATRLLRRVFPQADIRVED